MLGTVGCLTAGALAGCSLLGDTVEAEADQAAVGSDALDAAGYEFDSDDTFVVEETVEVQDTSKDVELTNWITTYIRTLQEVEMEGAQFRVITSPTVSIASKDVNPLRRMDEEQLLQEISGRGGVQGLKDIESVGERTVSVLESDVQVTEYKAVTEQNEIEVRVHFGNLTHEGDFLMVMGMHPQLLDETENVDALANGVGHPSEP